MSEKIYTLLQLCDSAFPTGGFSHSMGAEAAIANSYIDAIDDLHLYVLGALENLGSFGIPFVKSSWENPDKLGKLFEIDSLLDVMLTNHVAKHASLQQGQTLLISSINSFGFTKLKEIQELVDDGKLHGHQAVIFGLVCSLLDVDMVETLQMYAFCGLRGILASLVRLGKIGSLEAQQYQFKFQKCLTDIVNRNQSVDVANAFLAFPLVDIIQMSHDTLFSKLFIS